MDENRRKFLKILLIGSGVFVMEKVLPLFPKFLNDSLAGTKASTPDALNAGTFHVAEDQKTLSVYDSSGEEVLQIDKGA